MKMGNRLKKALSSLLTIALVMCSVQWVDGGAKTVLAENVTFDDNNIVLRIGVVSDIHLAYGTANMYSIKNNTKQYVKDIVVLNEYSKDEMDVLLLGGDYTGYGMYEQGKTFATATKVAMDEINKNKSEGNKTQLLMTYGNHDTDCNGQMTYTEWENLFDEEGLKLLDGVTRVYNTEGNEGVEGCYSYVYTDSNGVKHYFFSLETESYNNPSNTFTVDALNWLDEELARLEAADEDNEFVYIISHAPIKESGVYGSDPAYDGNADWATAEGGTLGAEKSYTRTIRVSGNSDEIKEEKTLRVKGDIHSILAKYPNVVYMSGHTHYTDRIESSIMAKDYTAINIPCAQTETLFSSSSEYLDAYKNGAYGATVDGATTTACSIYIEVDKEGRQRITRIDTTNSDVISVEVVGEELVDVAENPMVNTNWEYTTNPKVEAFYSSGVTVTKNVDGSVRTIGNPWVMDAPKGDGDTDHLTPYTAETRNTEAGTPVFNEGAISISNIKTTGQLAFDFSFPTAKVANGHYVMRYDLVLKDQDGKVLDTDWILGNWTDNTEGCADGYTHQTATELTYTKAISGDKVNSVTGFSLSITAWNEFGGSTTISSEPVQGIEVITKPPVGAYYEDLFDGLTLDDMVINSNGGNANVYSEKIDAKGNVEVTYNTRTTIQDTDYTSANDEFIYILNDKYSSADFAGWGKVGRLASKATTINPKDTFVYATDFNITNGSDEVYFTFRAPETSSQEWRMDYTGVTIGASQVQLKLAGGVIKTVSGDYSDGNTHSLTVLSSPTRVTVWIDNDIIFENVEFDVSKLCTGTGTTEDPYTYNNAPLKSTTMYPVIAMYSNGKAQFKVNNQFLHVYNQEEDLSQEFGATEKNYYVADSVVGADATTLNGFMMNEIELGTTKTVSLDLSSAFETTDKVIMEFDITPGDFTPGTSDTMSKIIGFQMKYRKDSSLSSNNYATLTERYLNNGLYQEIYNHFHDDYRSGITSNGKFTANTTYHYKIVSDNEQVSIWVDDVAIATNARYDALTPSGSLSKVSCDKMIPVFVIEFTSASWKVQNIEIRKADGSGTLDNVTQVTNENNLMNEYGDITSSFKGNNEWEGKTNSTVNGNNFYTDLTCMNLDLNEATSYYMGEDFSLFGANNDHYALASNESFIMSALVKVSNTKLEFAEGQYQNNRVGAEFATYDKIKPWYFIESETSDGVETTKLYVYHTDEFNGNILVGTVNLSTLIDYDRSVYNRITNVVSPFGYDIYINGLQVFSKEIGNGSNVSFNTMKFTVNGVEATFVDVSVCYNKENAELYERKIQEAIRNYEQTMKGVYGAQKAEMDAQISEMKANCKAANGNYNTLKTYTSYVSSIDAYKNELLTTGRVVNNQVKQGLTTFYGKDAYVNATDGTRWVNKHLPLFEEGTCLFDEQSIWVIEADVSTKEADFVSDKSMRIGLSLLGDAEGIVFIQNGQRYYRPANAQEFTWKANASGATGSTLRQTGTWHVKFIITEDESLQTIVTTENGAEVLHNFTIDLAAAGYDFAGKDLNPKLYFACGIYNVSDLEVYSLENRESNKTVVDTEFTVDGTGDGTYNKWIAKYVPLFAKGASPFTIDDTWVVEADVKTSDFVHNNMRIGLRLINAGECTLMIQNGQRYYRSTTATDFTWKANASGATGTTLRVDGGEFHVKYIITKNESIRTIITSLDGNTVIHDYTVSFSDLGYTLTSDTDFYPELYVVSGLYEISNLYVGYDLTSDIDKLNNAVLKEVDFSGKTWASEQAYKAVLENASTMNAVVQTYVDGMTEIIYTTPYSKAEINAEVTKLANAESGLVDNDATVTVGDETIGKVAVGLADGDTLPTGYVQDKYITGWTLNNESIETYSKGTEGYEAEYIDINMLDIKIQGKKNSEDAEKRDIRFISSVNTTKGYKRAGLVFSLSNHNPTEGGTKCTTKSKTKVYSSLIADGVSKDAKAIYGNEYSQLLFAHEYTKFSTDQTVYVRAFVQLADDTIVYGDVRKVVIQNVEL